MGWWGLWVWRECEGDGSRRTVDRSMQSVRSVDQSVKSVDQSVQSMQSMNQPIQSMNQPMQSMSQSMPPIQSQPHPTQPISHSTQSPSHSTHFSLPPAHTTPSRPSRILTPVKTPLRTPRDPDAFFCSCCQKLHASTCSAVPSFSLSHAGNRQPRPASPGSPRATAVRRLHPLRSLPRRLLRAERGTARSTPL